MQENGTFVAKVFRGRDVGKLYQLLQIMFKEVYCAKPKASRNSSYESFIVAKGFIPKNAKILEGHLLEIGNENENEESKESKEIMKFEPENVKFVSCGGDKAYDSDKNYALEIEGEKYEFHEPTQAPINPPYKEYLKMFKK